MTPYPIGAGRYLGAGPTAAARTPISRPAASACSCCRRSAADRGCRRAGAWTSPARSRTCAPQAASSTRPSPTPGRAPASTPTRSTRRRAGRQHGAGTHRAESSRSSSPTVDPRTPLGCGHVEHGVSRVRRCCSTFARRVRLTGDRARSTSPWRRSPCSRRCSPSRGWRAPWTTPRPARCCSWSSSRSPSRPGRRDPHRGRTLGKLAMGLRAVRDDGGPIRLRHAVVRALVGFVEIWLWSASGPGLLAAGTAGAAAGRAGGGTYVVRERAAREHWAWPTCPPSSRVGRRRRPRPATRRARAVGATVPRPGTGDASWRREAWAVSWRRPWPVRLTGAAGDGPTRGLPGRGPRRAPPSRPGTVGARGARAAGWPGWTRSSPLSEGPPA